jgi:hypothetical protein
MLTQNGSVGSRKTSLIGSTGWASHVMMRSEKLKVAMKPSPSAIRATMIRCRSSPRWARNGMRPSSMSCGSTPGGRVFRKNITRAEARTAPTRAGSRRG